MTDKNVNSPVNLVLKWNRIIQGQTNIINGIAWSPDGRILITPSNDTTIRLWDTQTGQLIRTLMGHSDLVLSVAWSPKGHILASGAADNTIRFWDTKTGQTLQTLTGHSNAILSVAWSPDGRSLASGSEDTTIRLWDFDTGRLTNIYEGHTGPVQSVSFSSDRRFLASKSYDGTVRIWRIGISEPVKILEELASGNPFAGLAFHPNLPILATLGEFDAMIRLWDLEVSAQAETTQSSAVHYTNAKVVLVGDSGVGKTGLGLV